MKFRAKPRPFDYEPFEYDWLEEKVDDDGYITGYYVDGYIVGDFVEVNEEYTHLEFWVPIQKETLIAIEEDDEEGGRKLKVLIQDAVVVLPKKEGTLDLLNSNDKELEQ